MERQALNIGSFLQYLDDFSQVWFRLCLADSNFLWKNSNALFLPSKKKKKKICIKLLQVRKYLIQAFK